MTFVAVGPEKKIKMVLSEWDSSAVHEPSISCRPPARMHTLPPPPASLSCVVRKKVPRPLSLHAIHRTRSRVERGDEQASVCESVTWLATPARQQSPSSSCTPSVQPDIGNTATCRRRLVIRPKMPLENTWARLPCLERSQRILDVNNGMHRITVTVRILG